MKMGGAFSQTQQKVLPHLWWPGREFFVMMEDTAEEERKSDGDCGAVTVCLFFFARYCNTKIPDDRKLSSLLDLYASAAFGGRWRGLGFFILMK